MHRLEKKWLEYMETPYKERRLEQPFKKGEEVTDFKIVPNDVINLGEDLLVTEVWQPDESRLIVKQIIKTKKRNGSTLYTAITYYKDIDENIKRRGSWASFEFVGRDIPFEFHGVQQDLFAAAENNSDDDELAYYDGYDDEYYEEVA